MQRLMARSVSDPQVVLVVGASSGIGAETAASLASRGHQVFGSSRDPVRVQLSGVAAVRLEVTDEGSVRECIAEVIECAGRIDAVVYSAGFYAAGAAEETSPELMLAQLDAYLVGAHRVVRAVAPSMRERSKGRILFMSSSAAVAAIPFHAAYSASKAALNHYAEALRYEVEPFGIQIACMEGTGVQTGAARARRMGEGPIEAYELARGAAVAAFSKTQSSGPRPVAIARSIVRAIEARNMRPLYPRRVLGGDAPLAPGAPTADPLSQMVREVLRSSLDLRLRRFQYTERRGTRQRGRARGAFDPPGPW